MSDAQRWPLPIFVALRGVAVAVVGGGHIAERKVGMLLDGGAEVTVVAPEVTRSIEDWAAAGRLALKRRPYEPGDLHGAKLAYAATSHPDVNRAVRDEARAAGVWLNAVDQPELCDFITPACVRRGDLTIAVSTDGRAPGFAKQVRENLERQYGPACAEDLAAAAAARPARQAGSPSAPDRATPGGRVFLVGAGPGDPDLLTVKGRRLLEQADAVVYDALVSTRLLDCCRPGAELVYVGKRDSRHTLPQAEINRLLVTLARAGRRVVRLKGGDPFIFGRGGEEAEALAQSGVAYEVVPGVSAGVAVPAAAGIPLTHREFTSELVFLTGHECVTDRPSIDWGRYAASRASLVIFMGVHNLPGIARSLLEHGRDPACPVAIIENGTTEAQRTIVASLDSIVEVAREASVKAPALIVVGEVVKLRERLMRGPTLG
jgi:uroporphyrin-III C-methyltransferase / precorrin-2 dehydrogenase / sirohydrochlorin ferrochelatase